MHRRSKGDEKRLRAKKKTADKEKTAAEKRFFFRSCFMPVNDHSDTSGKALIPRPACLSRGQVPEP